MIPTRLNGQIIDSSWFQKIADAVSEMEASFAIADGQAAAALAGQSFDGTNISSVAFEFELQRSTTVFVNGKFYFQYLNGTWRWVDAGGAGEDSGLTFTPTQVGTVGTLNVAASSGVGSGTLKIKRRSFDAEA